MVDLRHSARRFRMLPSVPAFRLLCYGLMIQTASAVISYGFVCAYTVECKADLTCFSKICRCTDQEYYVQNNAADLCQPKRSNGISCNQIDQCKADLSCVGNMCRCTDQEYYVPNNAADLCQPKKLNGTSCSNTVECMAGLTCIANICRCYDLEYYDPNNAADLCQPKKSFAYSCVRTDECRTNLSCLGHICRCTDQEYFNSSNVADLCQSKKRNGVYCTSINECMAGLSCLGNICRCDDQEYYDPNNAADLCQPKLNYGVSCYGINAADVCQEPHSVCISYHSPPNIQKCLCSSDYYRTDENNCTSRMHLINQASSTRQVNFITLTWPDTSQRSNVNYTIAWMGGSVGANRTGGNATGLTAGTLYSFSVISTLPPDENYPSIVNQSEYQLWTYPDVPGDVQAVTRISNSTSETFIYNIQFGSSNGNVASYTMAVAGVGTKYTTSLAVTFQLNPATTYMYTLKSYNGRTPQDASGPRTGTFKTNPKESGPVQNLYYTELLEYAAKITWQTPSHPNGNLTGYFIQVKLQDSGECLYNIQLPCCGQQQLNVDPDCAMTEPALSHYDGTRYHLDLPKLKPYHNYSVEVVAVNELGSGLTTRLSFRTKMAAANNIANLVSDSTRDENNLWVNFNISWTHGDYTGPTLYHIHVQPVVGPGSTVYSSDTKEAIVQGYNNTTYKIYNVRAFWNYSISVMAATEAGNSHWSVAQFQTAPNRPGAPKNLAVKQHETVAKKLCITFACPDEDSRNGTITKFVIRQTLIGTGHDILTYYNITDEAATSCKNVYTFSDVKDILVEQNYSFDVMTVNSNYTGDFGESVTLTIKPKAAEVDVPVGAIVGGVIGGLALITVVCAVIIIMRRKAALKRKSDAEQSRENLDVKSSKMVDDARYDPIHTPRGHILLTNLDENLHVYSEISDYENVGIDSLHSSRDSHSPKIHVIDTKAAKKGRPYENVGIDSLHSSRDSHSPKIHVIDTKAAKKGRPYENVGIDSLHSSRDSHSPKIHVIDTKAAKKGRPYENVITVSYG